MRATSTSPRRSRLPAPAHHATPSSVPALELDGHLPGTHFPSGIARRFTVATDQRDESLAVAPYPRFLV